MLQYDRQFCVQDIQLLVFNPSTSTGRWSSWN